MPAIDNLSLWLPAPSAPPLSAGLIAQRFSAMARFIRVCIAQISEAIWETPGHRSLI